MGLIEGVNESKANVLFETRAKGGVLLRGSYLAK
jgi:hypothetical protein